MIDLIKKGLRLQIHGISVDHMRENDWPDKKGIKTQFHDQSCIVLQYENDWPDEKGIKTYQDRCVRMQQKCENDWPDKKGIKTLFDAMGYANSNLKKWYKCQFCKNAGEVMFV